MAIVVAIVCSCSFSLFENLPIDLLAAHEERVTTKGKVLHRVDRSIIDEGAFV